MYKLCKSNIYGRAFVLACISLHRWSNEVASDCISLLWGSLLRRIQQYYFILPFCLHTACEALEDTFDKDCINPSAAAGTAAVAVAVWWSSYRKKIDASLNVDRIRWTHFPVAFKMLHRFILADDSALEVLFCGWSSWQPLCNNLVKYSGVLVGCEKLFVA